jgi:hypothetical protein
MGRPLLYGTTPGFLEQFALRHLGELPRGDELAIALRHPGGLTRTVDVSVETRDSAVQQLQLTETREEPPASAEQQPSPYAGEETDTQVIEPTPSDLAEQPEAADTAV